jgi:hypothetical protein
MANLLILCHPKNIPIRDNKIENHWYADIINDICDNFEMKINEVTTVDIKEGGTLKLDCFTKGFYLYNMNSFDFVIAPDCGGNWFHYQEADNRDGFKTLVKGIVLTAKENGLILIDKFTADGYRDFTKEILEENCEILECNCKGDFEGISMNFILARKISN